MSAHAGQTAEKTGTFHCAQCGETVHVARGEPIPQCPNGHGDFTERIGEPE